jgi:hypothetical protein
MKEAPEYRNEQGKAKAEALMDRIKAWRADYDAVQTGKETEAKREDGTQSGCSPVDHSGFWPERHQRRHRLPRP